MAWEPPRFLPKSSIETLPPLCAGLAGGLVGWVAGWLVVWVAGGWAGWWLAGLGWWLAGWAGWWLAGWLLVAKVGKSVSIGHIYVLIKY